jgi:hypothetical protein
VIFLSDVQAIVEVENEILPKIFVVGQIPEIHNKVKKLAAIMNVHSI